VEEGVGGWGLVQEVLHEMMLVREELQSQGVATGGRECEREHCLHLHYPYDPPRRPVTRTWGNSHHTTS
jgi:hypothetical protein